MTERLNELETTLQKAKEIQSRLETSLPPHARPFFSEQKKLPRGSLVVGPRGVGKTTYLLNEAKNNHILYFSVDSPIFARFTLTELAEAAFSHGYDGVIFDEVHFARDWSRHLKSVYDSFPTKKIWASDSSSLVLREGIADLSRRLIKIHVPLLSFREFLYLSEGVLFNKIPLFSHSDSIKKEVAEILKKTPVMRLFKYYIKSGLRPFFLEGDYEARILGIIEKTIYTDIPFFLPQVQETYLRLMNSVMGYLSQAPIPTLNIESLCKEWGLGKEKLYQLLAVMKNIQLIRIVRKKEDHKVQSKGEKIFLFDPSFYSAMDGGRGSKGNVREAYTALVLEYFFGEVWASKNESECDYIAENYKIEVGGKNKKAKSADIVVQDDLDIPTDNRYPLWLLGMSF